MNSVLNDLQQHAQEGDLQSQYELSLKYYNKGEYFDPRQGYLWMKVAAESGYLKAQKALGLLYSSSQHSPYPEENAFEALRMYRMAADQGDAQAQFWLGRCYLYGYGTEVNSEEGRRWIAAARAKGYEEEAEESIPREDTANTGDWEFYKDDDDDDSPKARYGLKDGENEEDEKPVSPAIETAQDSLKANRFDRIYFKTGLIFAGFGLLVGLALGGIVDLVIALLSSGSSLYLLVLLILGLIGAGFGFSYGYNVAHQQARDMAYYRSTPFYDQYGVDYDVLGHAAQNEYEIYTRLSRIFLPFGHKSRIKTKTVFGSVRGYIIPNLLIPGRDTMSAIDLLVLSEKALYCLNIRGISGEVSGAAEDVEWNVQTRSGRTRYLANPLLAGREAIQSLQDAMRTLCEGGVWVHDVPIYSIVVFEEGVNIEKITGVNPEERQYVLSCGGEKVRSFIEMQESRNSLHTKETEQMMHAVQLILKNYEENRKKQKEGKH